MSKERENWKLGTRTSCKWCQGKIRAPLFDDIGPEITGAKMPENVCADQGRLCVLLLFLIGLMQKGKKKKFPFESAGWSCFRELDFVIIWIKLAGTFSRGFELNINVLLAIFFFGATWLHRILQEVSFRIRFWKSQVNLLLNVQLWAKLHKI